MRPTNTPNYSPQQEKTWEALSSNLTAFSIINSLQVPKGKREVNLRSYLSVSESLHVLSAAGRSKRSKLQYSFSSRVGLQPQGPVDLLDYR